MAEKVIQRTKHSSPLHIKKRRSSTLGPLFLPFTLLNLPHGHHSVCRSSKHPAQHHYMKSKEASSLIQHICRTISVVTQANSGQIKAEYPGKMLEAREAAQVSEVYRHCPLDQQSSRAGPTADPAENPAVGQECMGYFLRKLHTEGVITEKQEEKFQSCPLTAEVQ